MTTLDSEQIPVAATLSDDELCALQPIESLRMAWDDYVTYSRLKDQTRDEEIWLHAMLYAEHALEDAVADLLDVPRFPFDDGSPRTTGSAGLDAVKVARLRSGWEANVAARSQVKEIDCNTPRAAYDMLVNAQTAMLDAVCDLLGVKNELTGEAR
jgi:hypothetical protein